MPDIPIKNTDIWREFGPVDNGLKKLVKGEGADQKVAYFKPISRREGPTAANEYISSKLGEALGFPVAVIQIINFGGEDGILSLEIPNANPWQVFPDKVNSRALLLDSTVPSKILTFDFWIFNRDRHDKNLIFQSVGEGKYQIFMIDHEHCLFGAQNNPPNPDDYTGIIKLFDLAKQLTDQSELVEQATLVQGLADDAIIKIVDDFRLFAPTYLDEAQATAIKELLIKRKNALPDKVAEWYNAGEWK